MCITFGPAHLSSTLLYAAEAQHDGRTVHVLGYQNSAENRAPGPNAMILPFPSAEPMTSANIIDTSDCPKILKDYAESLRKRRRSRSMSKGYDSLDLRSVQVFDSGSYTVVLATHPTEIPKALRLVPTARRPEANAAVLEAFERIYPDWPIALCCFNSREMPEPDPLLWWYVPKNKDMLFLPALDAHDGGPPDLDAKVKVDHTVILGTDPDRDLISPVRFQDEIPVGVRPFLASKVVGLEARGHGISGVDNGAGFKGRLRNGDFVVPVADARAKVSLTATDYRVSPRYGNAA